MAKKKLEVSKTVQGECPWCNYENDNEKKGPLHEKEDSKVELGVNGRYQCSTCGKHWRQESLGKEWTLELERGPRWERENKGRQLSS